MAPGLFRSRLAVTAAIGLIFIIAFLGLAHHQDYKLPESIAGSQTYSGRPIVSVDPSELMGEDAQTPGANEKAPAPPAEKPPAEKPQAEKPPAEKPAEKPAEEKPPAEKPAAEEKPAEEDTPEAIPSPPPAVDDEGGEPASPPAEQADVPEGIEDEALFDFFMNKMWQSRVGITDKVYKPYGAFEYKIPDDWTPQWTEPMGEDLCIIDLDSRPLNDEGQVFNEKLLNWDDADGLSGTAMGIMTHWMYAKLHGYKYYFVKTGTYEDRRDSWKKPSVIGRILQKHKTCVFLDSDALFNHPDLPFEWLLNHWKIDKTKDAIAMSPDPASQQNRDEQGKVYVNTGFIISQNTPVIYDIFKDWHECADDGGKYPACPEYRSKHPGHPSDQGGFGNYVRYDYEENVRELPCSEANGFPEEKSNCMGTFVKHLWTGKRDVIKVAIGQMIPGGFLPVLHKQFLKEKKSYYVTEDHIFKEEFLKGVETKPAKTKPAGW